MIDTTEYERPPENWVAAANRDGKYAIALALWEVAHQLRDLGNGGASNPGHIGAIEAFGMHLDKALDRLGDAIASLKS